MERVTLRVQVTKPDGKDRRELEAEIVEILMMTDARCEAYARVLQVDPLPKEDQ